MLTATERDNVHMYKNCADSKKVNNTRSREGQNDERVSETDCRLHDTTIRGNIGTVGSENGSHWHDDQDQKQ